MIKAEVGGIKSVAESFVYMEESTNLLLDGNHCVFTLHGRSL